MTRISSAQVSPSLLDQIGTQTTMPKDGGNTAAFDSHLAHFGSDGNGEPVATDANSDSSKTNANDAQTSGKDQSDSVTALFAALSGDAQATSGDAQAANASAGTAKDGGSKADFNSQLARFSDGVASCKPASDPANVSSSTAGSSDSSPKGSTNSVSALIAALSGDTQGSEAQTSALTAGQTPSATDTNAAANSDAAPSNNVQVTVQMVQTPVVPVNTAAAGAPITQTRSGATNGTSPKDVASPTQTKPASKAPAASDTKTDDPSTTTANAAPDPSASTQTAVAMMAASLTTQNTTTTQASRKLAWTPGSSSTVYQSRTQPANASSLGTAGSEVALANGLQSPSVTPSSTQTDQVNPFADLTQDDGSSSQTIKMKLSSIQAETHFAPVQSLSPTTQIAEFVASAAGNMASTESPDDAAGATTSSQSTAASTAPTTLPLTSMIKTLTLSLEPDSLGTVTVTMRLGNSGLDLQLEAAKSETTSLIDKDKGSLSDRLQSLGYSVDSLVVKTAAAQGTHQDPSSDQSAAGQGQQPAGQDASASGSSQNGGRSANDQSAPRSGRETAPGLGQDSSPDPSSVRSVGDGVYV